ncbi:JAB domain-containing protein [Vreelandella sp. F11]
MLNASLPYSAAAIILDHNHGSADPEPSNVVQRIVV